MKLKDAIDWARRAQFVYQMLVLLLSGSVLTAVRAFIYKTSIPVIWRWPIYLASFALALLLFSAAGRWWNDRNKASLAEARETIHDVKVSGGRAATLFFLEARAKELSARLEELWHSFQNANEKLIHPLDSRIDKLQDFSTEGQAMRLIKEHSEFLVLYVHHLTCLKADFPDFTSPVTKKGFPSASEYLQTRADLKEHEETLGRLAQEAWD